MSDRRQSDTTRRSTREPRLFRALLRLLPFEFRSDHGRDMEQVSATSGATRPRRDR